MKLKFKKQQYQENAIQAVVDCFNGQTSGTRTKIIKEKKEDEKDITNWNEPVVENIISFGNKKIELTLDELRKNIRSVQKQNNLDYTDNAGFLNYSIEMETGTGKTYTYIKTMYELNKNYGWSKFIVMTPSIPIREGVLKTFQITEDHFQELYGKKIRYFVYDSNNSANLSNINNFAEDNSIQVMIINYQAFNFNPEVKSVAKRKIYESLDDLQTRKPIDVIKATNPILIVDEPQKMGKTEDRLTVFEPLFILRYSATHKNNFKYNMIYRLDAVDAYNQKLVKKINVKGIELLHSKSDGAYLYLEGVEISKGEPAASMEIEVKSADGVRKKIVKLKKNSKLFKLSGGLEQYKGYIVSEINVQNMYDEVLFTNGEKIQTGQIAGDTRKDYMTRIQIKETIKSHFEKEKEYFEKGIKVLSLFFIDEVAKYKVYDKNKVSHDGEYAKIFLEEYNQIFNEYYKDAEGEYKKYLENLKDKKVHSGYFSIDKKASKGMKKSEQIFIDKIDDKKEKTSSDEEAYDLIMRDKEKLLSLDEPVRFIFSHSALREGWDNPNIFQICTLKNSHSDISRRQEIGRGLRIAVNNYGERMDYSMLEDDFFRINNLTVIASESYDSFAKSLQSDIAEGLSRTTYEVFDNKLFENKILRNLEGESKIIDSLSAMKILMNFTQNGYVDSELKITEKLREDIENNTIDVPSEFSTFQEEYVNLIKTLFTNTQLPVENKNKENIRELKPNKNFDIKEFQELWNKINQKTVYQVNFDTDELIKRAVKKIDKELRISRVRVKVTEGGQRDALTSEQIKSGRSMESKKTKVDVYEDFVPVKTKYDLIGDIAKDTELTRHTVISILEQIKPDVFAQFQYNPEEFIRKATKLINEERAIIVVDGITYSKTNEKYNDKIFDIKNISGKIGVNAIKVQKHIYDYIVTDSKNEIEFAKQLEDGDALVYAKLPRQFKIPTPLGNYNPDWAVVLDKNKFKHVYFIAETKGSMSSSDLRGTENGKIECARKHFETISDGFFEYKVVDNYDRLIDFATDVMKK